MKIPSIRQIEKAIKLPVKKWEGNCYAVACAIIKAKLVKGRAVYGTWTGKTAKGTRWEGRLFCRHGWIETPEGIIVDPTRWSFEGVAPYVWVGEPPESDRCFLPCSLCGHIGDEHGTGFFKECKIEGCDCHDFDPEVPDWPYDEGGNDTRDAFKVHSDCPEFNASEPCVTLNIGTEALLILQHLAKRVLTQKMSVGQQFWVGNVNPKHLGPYAKEVFQALAEVGNIEFIPVDNRIKLGIK